MELFHKFLHFVYIFFVIASVLTMSYGFLYTAYNILFKRKNIDIGKTIRNYFDKSVLFGLQILIVADIIETIIAPDLMTIFRVFCVVIIRTIMSISLHWEIKSEK